MLRDKINKDGYYGELWVSAKFSSDSSDANSTVLKVDGVWKREGPPVMMVSPDSAQQYYFREKCVPVDADHSQIAKITRGQNGVYPNVKSAIKHGLIGTAKIVATADASLESTTFVGEVSIPS